MDPFFLQLILIPAIAVAIGIITTLLSNRIFLGAFITLILNASYEIWYFTTHYGTSFFSAFEKLSSWNIILPLLTLTTSTMTYYIRKTSQRIKEESV